MGRRIPKSRKHKKIKAVDPFYRGERRKNENDGKRNDTPRNPNEQEIPRKLKEIQEFQNSLGLMKKRRKKKSSSGLTYNEGDDYGPNVKGCEREPQPIQKFDKFKGETNRLYISRLHMDALNAITQAKVESKFGVESTTTEGGKIEYTQESAMPVNKNMPVNMKKVTTTNKKEKRKKFQMKKKEKKKSIILSRKDDFAHLKADEVKFGVVADRPPTLTVLPRKSALIAKSKSMKNESLLLLKNLSTMNMPKPSSGFSQRRKYLDPSTRRQLEKERESVLTAYRDLKAKRMQSGNFTM